MRRSPLPNRSSLLLLLAAAVSLTTVAASSGPPPEDAPKKPAEESRLSTALFRAGLRKRGLTELLELHLKDFPLSSPTEALLMMREVKLAEHDDPILSPEQRESAIAEANRLLEQVIDENPDDARRFEWRFALAHSLLYDQAEPLFTSILYRGGNAADRQRLPSLSTRAVAVLRVLLGELATEYKRVDQLAIREFENLEAQGYIEELDRVGPRAEYLLLWAFFYDSLPRDDADPVRTQQLNDILERVAVNAALLKTPHKTSRVQVQALLLTGMTHRLLNNHQPARELLDRALAVTEQLGDPDERQRIQWAVTLTWLERIRNDRDDGRFDEALSQLVRFRNTVAAGGADTFGLRVVAALLERSIYEYRAAAAERANRTADARRYREEAWKPLARLAQQEPEHRDELYATIYDMVGHDVSPDKLDPFERCALIAGLLSDASGSTGNADSLLDRAIEVGERFLAEAGPGAKSLVPEVLYNIAVAEYRRGRLAAAATRLIEVGRDYPTFAGAPQAADFAAQLGAKLRDDPSLRSHPEVQGLYRKALEVLVTRHTDTDAARYWRFYYAQLLDELGDYDKASSQYALVDQTHEH
ncbi:MAG: tetratricopeptide repeat protein, partial [Phycisphaerae bacterium]